MGLLNVGWLSTLFFFRLAVRRLFSAAANIISKRDLLNAGGLSTLFYTLGLQFVGYFQQLQMSSAIEKLAKSRLIVNLVLL